jgi:tetratricopeptide (TPR) repeat protein
MNAILQKSASLAESADAYRCLARFLLADGQWEAGAAAYQEAIRLDPGDEENYNQLGLALQFEAGKVTDAIAVYRQGITALPASAWLHFRLALALDHLGHSEESIAEYLEAIRLEPGMDGFRLNLAHLLHDAGRLDEALAEYKEVLRLSPGEELPDAVQQILDRTANSSIPLLPDAPTD